MNVLYSGLLFKNLVIFLMNYHKPSMIVRFQYHHHLPVNRILVIPVANVIFQWQIVFDAI